MRFSFEQAMWMIDWKYNIWDSKRRTIIGFRKVERCKSTRVFRSTSNVTHSRVVQGHSTWRADNSKCVLQKSSWIIWSSWNIDENWSLSKLGRISTKLSSLPRYYRSSFGINELHGRFDGAGYHSNKSRNVAKVDWISPSPSNPSRSFSGSRQVSRRVW